MTTTKFVTGAALSAAALLLTACSGSSGASESAGTAEGTVPDVSMAITADPGSLNPQLNATEDSTQLAYLAYESLVVLPSGGEAQPLLASSWEVTPTQIVFTLNPDATCSDGSQVTASDVVASFDWLNNPDNGSPYYEVYMPSDTTYEGDDDAGTVTVNYTSPQSFGLENVGAIPVMCGAGIKDPTLLDDATYGSGPYTLTDSTAGMSYTYSLRDDYGTVDAAGLPATINVQVVSDADTRLNMLLAGDLNLTKLTGSSRDRVQDQGYQEVGFASLPNLLFFNEAEGRATNQLEVRQALAAAIDRDSVGSVSTQSRGSSMVMLETSGMTSCAASDASAAIPTFDTDKAAELLDAAGWTLGADGVREKDGTELTIKLLYNVNGGEGMTAGVQLLQQELGEVGVSVELTPSDSYTSVIFAGGDWDMVWAPIAVAFPSTWAGILSGDFPPDGGNWTYNTNAEYQAVAAQAQELSGAESCELWTDAESLLFENVDVLPLWEGTETTYSKGFTVELDSTGVVIPTSFAVAD